MPDYYFNNIHEGDKISRYFIHPTNIPKSKLYLKTNTFFSVLTYFYYEYP